MKNIVVFDSINELTCDDFPAIVSVCDKDGVVLFCNNFFLDFYGIKNKKPAKNLTLFDLDASTERKSYNELFVSLFSGVKHNERIYKFNTSNSTKVLNYNMKPIVYKGTNAILLVGIDITESYLKQKDEADFSTRISEINVNRLHKTLIDLDKAKKISDNNTKAKQDFMANISHEIRTPLNAILGFSQILADGTHLNEEQKKNIEAISDSAKALNAIINDVLDFSKIEAGKMTFELTEISLKDALDRLVRIFGSKAKEKNNTLTYSIAAELPKFIQVDEVRLIQIFINIIGNAIKFTNNGKISIFVERENEMLKIVVSDTGIGIAADKLSLIFDSYTQAEASTTRKYGGTGLGLSIVKKLVSLQGGSVSVESKEGKGSSFFVLLPLIEGKEKDKKTNKQKFSESLNNRKVLVVEDHPLNRLLIEQYLKALNTDFTIVNDGEEALALFSKPDVKFDAVLMDIQLPGKDGHEVTKILRNDFKVNTPIIALTANAFNEERERCFESGMNDYLKKPFYIEDLYLVLNKHIIANSLNVDLTFLKNYTNNNKAFAKQILDAFVMQTPTLLRDMDNARLQKDLIKMKAIAHKLIPSSVYVGLKDLEDTLKELELCKEDYTVINSLVNQIINQSESAIEQIKKEIILLT